MNILPCTLMMADIVKSRSQFKIPKYVLAYYPSDRTTCVVSKSKLLNEDVLKEFMKHPVAPENIEEGVKIAVRFKNPVTKKEEIYDGYLIAATCQYFYYKSTVATLLLGERTSKIQAH